MPQVTLLVIRHAPTDWNERGLIQGRSDPPLSVNGRSRATRWRVPVDIEFQRAYASPLRRAGETAALLGLDAVPEPALIEMAWGEFEGRRLADIRSELGSKMEEAEARGLDFRLPGGESPRDVQERLFPFLASLERPSVAVTHKGVIRALYALATGWRMLGPPPDKLREGCGQLFSIARDGTPSPLRLNVALDTVRAGEPA